jgi:5-methyltetrahydropteroyltriglutamate--homocysteine methyltransferase
MQTYAYGFPRLGKNREFKKTIESFWDGKISDKELVSLLGNIERERISFYENYVDNFALGEFTYYDNIFDNALVFGVYKFKSFEDYFEYTRGKIALEMKKYFNTNYHYLVPSLDKNTKFSVSWNKPLFYFNSFASAKDNPMFLIGPYTFLKLSRLQDNMSFEKTLLSLVASYQKLFKELVNEGIKSVHIEEPAFSLDVPQSQVSLIKKVYKRMINPSLKVNLITYYESVDFLSTLYDLPIEALGLDFVAGQDNLKSIKKLGFPKDKKLICGIVDGHSVRRSNVADKAKYLETIRKNAKINQDNILISNSCPLFHLPVTLDNEANIAPSAKSKISFAKERLQELNLIKKFLEGDNRQAKQWGKDIEESQVQTTSRLFDTLALKESQFLKRKQLQQKNLKLPLFPTTTIGSFPQDKELRKMRLKFKKGEVSLDVYDSFIRGKISELIDLQKTTGLDVLVHGEFERTDMVEFFAKGLKGFLTTDNGWIISYGTRGYRPPIVYDKIEREAPLTVKETFYADQLTSKAVKGIFTGPITILAWSYNLRKEPIYEVAFELAKSLNDEAKELVNKGIKVIQVDEPAIREFAPIKKRKRDFYFSWAIRAFNLTAKLPPQIQIHTHMCYSEFGEITKWIMKMAFDVITIEAAREKAKIVDSFKGQKFNRGIGPGVWDIHSKYPAQIETIKEILDKSIDVFGADNVWVNPDCGLKTRKLPEVEISLKRIMKVAKEYRKKFVSKTASTC